MFCHKCGTQIDESVVFCPKCGTKQGFASNSADQQNFAYAKPDTNAYNYVETEGSPKHVEFGEAIKLFFVNYVNFSGRSTKSEYWWAFLFNFLVGFFLGFFTVFVPGLNALSTIFSLGTFLPGMAVGVRRLHDTGKSGWYLLISLIPIVGAILLIVEMCKDSAGDNEWGLAPRNKNCF